MHADEKADFEFRWDILDVASGMRVRSKAGMAGVFWRKRTPQEDNDDTLQQNTLTRSELHGDYPNHPHS